MQRSVTVYLVDKTGLVYRREPRAIQQIEASADGFTAVAVRLLDERGRVNTYTLPDGRPSDGREDTRLSPRSIETLRRAFSMEKRQLALPGT